MTNESDLRALKNDIELARGIGQLAGSVNTAITILAKAILELEDPEGNHYLTIGTRNALRSLSETDSETGGLS